MVGGADRRVTKPHGIQKLTAKKQLTRENSEKASSPSGGRKLAREAGQMVGGFPEGKLNHILLRQLIFQKQINTQTDILKFTIDLSVGKPQHR